MILKQIQGDPKKQERIWLCTSNTIRHRHTILGNRSSHYIVARFTNVSFLFVLYGVLENVHFAGIPLHFYLKTLIQTIHFMCTSDLSKQVFKVLWLHTGLLKAATYRLTFDVIRVSKFT